MLKRTILLAILFISPIPACTDSTTSTGNAPIQPAPAELAEGEKLFNNNCASCHGKGARGTDRGPTFLSKIYEPSHHGDSAFRLAPKNGVRAHHWQFGNMPKISGVTSAEVGKIISYIRWIQQENGIF